MSTPKNYSKEFYRSQLDESKRSAEAVLPFLLQHVPIKSVIDVGCGVGAWLKVYHDLGVAEVFGIDSENVPIDELLISKENYRVVNLNESIQLPRKYDLVNCLEVAEHLIPERAGSFIYDLVALGDLIVFSAAIPGQEGTGHLNEQYHSFWAEIFHRYGFIGVDVIRPEFWNHPGVCVWYKQNMMIFIKPELLSQYPQLTQLKSFHGANLVHPDYFQYKTTKADRFERISESLSLFLRNKWGKFKSRFKGQ